MHHRNENMLLFHMKSKQHVLFTTPFVTCSSDFPSRWHTTQAKWLWKRTHELLLHECEQLVLNRWRFNLEWCMTISSHNNSRSRSGGDQTASAVSCSFPQKMMSIDGQVQLVKYLGWMGWAQTYKLFSRNCIWSLYRLIYRLIYRLLKQS